MGPKTQFAQGLINAVLRKIAMPPEAQALEQGFGIAFPRWWLKHLQHAYPKEWQSICFQQEQRPALVLRINLTKTTSFEYQTVLDAKGIAYTLIDPIAAIPNDKAIVIRDPVPVSQIPGFEDGLVSVQDAGAQLAAILLDPKEGDRILDACAAPGGKTAHLAEWIGPKQYHLTALEIDHERLKRVISNIKRLGLAHENIKVIQGSASRQDWWDGLPFDKILLDVPCSASGIVRRHPDIVFLRREDDIAALVKVQRALLENAWRMLKPKGLLLYVTCSIFPQEGEGQMAWMAERHPNALRLEAPGQLRPGKHHDGFFYGLLQKN